LNNANWIHRLLLITMDSRLRGNDGGGENDGRTRMTAGV